MGKDEFRDRLVGKGAEALADALLDLVGTCDGAEQAVLRMISTRDENLQRFERGRVSRFALRHYGEPQYELEPLS